MLAVYPSLDQHKIVSPEGIISDGGDNQEYINDALYASHYSSSNSECFVGIDVGAGKKVKINRIRYFPYDKWTIASEKLQGAVIEASNDNTNYV